MEMFRGGEGDDDLSSSHPVDEDGYLLSGEESEVSDEESIGGGAVMIAPADETDPLRSGAGVLSLSDTFTHADGEATERPMPVRSLVLSDEQPTRLLRSSESAVGYDDSSGSEYAPNGPQSSASAPAPPAAATEESTPAGDVPIAAIPADCRVPLNPRMVVESMDSLDGMCARSVSATSSVSSVAPPTQSAPPGSERCASHLRELKQLINSNCIPAREKSSLRVVVERIERELRINAGRATSSEEEWLIDLDRSGKAWNERFQATMDMSDSPEKYRALGSIAHDFVYAAKTYGKIIISECTLPLEERTIMPLNMGGIAGGDKYLHQGILFKFSKDMIIKQSGRRTVYLYGGSTPNTAAAIKAASHDLKGLQNCYSTRVQGISYPLLALIDYRGYRLTAMTVLPINRQTIVYGSYNAGKDVHNSCAEFNELMREIGTALKLKEHCVGRSKKLLYTAGDIEGHVGRDGKKYLIDFARCFPPEAPPVSGMPLRAIFYQLLRPELLQVYDKALSCDAFSRFENDESSKEEVIEATRFLYDVLIPQFATYIDEHSDPFQLRCTAELHHHGINVRHCGRVRARCQNPQARRLLLSEMVGRVCKNIVNAQMRQTMQEERVPLVEPYRQLVVRFLNSVIGSESDSRAVWMEQIPAGLSRSFVSALAEDEVGEDLRLLIDAGYMFRRVLELTGIKVSSRAMKALGDRLRLPTRVRILASDVKALTARVKWMNVVDEAEANVLLSEARSYNGDCDALWELVNSKFKSALASNTHSHHLLFQWGRALYEQARVEEDERTSQSLLESAQDKLMRTVALRPEFHEAHMLLGHIVVERGALRVYGNQLQAAHFAEAEQVYREAMRLHPAHAVELIRVAEETINECESNLGDRKRQRQLQALVRSIAQLQALSRSVAQIREGEDIDQHYNQDIEAGLYFAMAKAMLLLVEKAKSPTSFITPLLCQAAHLLDASMERMPLPAFCDGRFLYILRVSESTGVYETMIYESAGDGFCLRRVAPTHPSLAASPRQVWLTHLPTAYDNSYLNISCLPIADTARCKLRVRHTAIVYRCDVDYCVLTRIHIEMFDAALMAEYARPAQVKVFASGRRCPTPSSLYASRDELSALTRDMICLADIDVSTMGRGDVRTSIAIPVEHVVKYVLLHIVPPPDAIDTEESAMVIKHIGFDGYHVYGANIGPDLTIERTAKEALRKRQGQLLTSSGTNVQLPALELQCMFDRFQMMRRAVHFQNDGLAALIRATAYSEKLRWMVHAHLGMCSRDVVMSIRASLVDFQTRYKQLELAKCAYVNDDVLGALAQALHRCEHLVLRNSSYFGWQGLASVGDAHPLVSLDLCGCDQLNDHALHGIARWTTLESLTLWSYKGDPSAYTSLRKLVNLRHLDISGCANVGDRAFAQLFRNFKHLEEFHARGCTSLSDIVLKSVVKECAGLRVLVLQGCILLSEQGMSVLSRCMALSSLDVRDIEHLSDCALLPLFTKRGRKKLEEISMTPSSIMASMLRSSPRPPSNGSISRSRSAEYGCVPLEELWLSRCVNFTDQLLTSLSDQSAALRVLDVSFLRVSESLAEIARRTTLLEELNVSHTRINSATLSTFVEQNRGLMTLSIDCAQYALDEGSMNSLCTAPSLEVLSVSGLDQVSDDVVVRVVSQSCTLRELNISSCPKTSSSTIDLACDIKPTVCVYWEQTARCCRPLALLEQRRVFDDLGVTNIL